ncbi:hypothetical protein DH2020_020425 [Rehmannia glutinosa]|uniref:Photosynthesis system II assembly factor Ycf48/Hcf136-like domain-containing protein n=1 Tax=Rehmannia glutinosa TaxID=99300 RepID=A0ABR0WG36_REHGL
MAAALQQLTLTHSSSSSIITPRPPNFCSYSNFRRRPLLPSASAARETPPPAQANAISRRELIGLHAAAAAAISLSPLGNKALAADDPLSEWERVYLLLTPALSFSTLLSSPTTLLTTNYIETKDGGSTWAPFHTICEDEDFNYRFNSISFKGKEGWIVGKPAILLYTKDAGDTWQRIPLSSQLPGDMVYIKATGEKGAEMVTDQGAIYITSNGGYNWKAAVQETVSATLNRTVSSGISGASYYTGTFSTVNRSPEGNYVAVSSRGNFYLTWEPGQITEEFEEIPVQSRGFGILDVGYRSQEEAWAAGGSGILLKTTNSGKTWSRDKAADNIAANLYSVKIRPSSSSNNQLCFKFLCYSYAHLQPKIASFVSLEGMFDFLTKLVQSRSIYATQKFSSMRQIPKKGGTFIKYLEPNLHVRQRSDNMSCHRGKSSYGEGQGIGGGDSGMENEKSSKKDSFKWWTDQCCKSSREDNKPYSYSLNLSRPYFKHSLVGRRKKTTSNRNSWLSAGRCEIDTGDSL